MLTKITNKQLSLIGIFSLVFLFSASETITLIAVEENANIFFKICIFLIIIFIFQVVIITFSKFNHYILSFLSVINIISLKLIYIKGIFSLKDYQQLILFLFFYFNFLILYKYYQKNLLFKRIAITTLSVLITIPILLNIFNIYSFGNTNLYKQSIKQFFSWTLSNQGKRLSDEYKKIKLNNTPDIYVMSFDGVPATKFMKKYFDISNTSYSETITNNNGRIFKNTFSMAVPTKNSLNNILMLDHNNYKLDYTRFNGKRDSLLFSILRNNNYKIVTGYAGNYLGKSKGKFIDDYITAGNNLSNSNTCIEDYSLFSYFIPRLFGICIIKNSFLFTDKKTRDLNSHASQHGNMDIWPDKILKRVSDINKDDNNSWISIFHMYRPIGHTDGNHKSSKINDQKFINEMFNPLSLKMSKIIKKLLKNLENSKKDFIILVISDHGLWFSRSVTEKNDYFYQDRHGIFLASIKTKNSCSENFEPYYTYSSNDKYYHTNDKSIFGGKDSFTSTGRLLMGLIHCLSEDNSKKIIEQNVDFENPHKFENYIIHD